MVGKNANDRVSEAGKSFARKSGLGFITMPALNVLHPPHLLSHLVIQHSVVSSIELLLNCNTVFEIVVDRYKYMTGCGGSE